MIYKVWALKNDVINRLKLWIRRKNLCVLTMLSSYLPKTRKTGSLKFKPHRTISLCCFARKKIVQDIEMDQKDYWMVGIILKFILPRFWFPGYVINTNLGIAMKRFCSCN